jgi:5-methylcytosine-specific restriction endonuclease McrA
MPINVIDAFEAVQKVFKGRALCVDVQTFGTYDFESWVVTWDDAIRTAKIAEGQRVVRTNGMSLVLPEVIVCTEYRGFGFKVNYRHKPKFSRRNLYLRDRNTCQFCGKRFYTEDLTMDHVIPKSKGGKVCWTNIVLACVSCNNRKSNLTLVEAEMRLIRQPFEPKVEDLKLNPVDRLRMKLGRTVPKNWEQFLGTHVLEC